MLRGSEPVRALAGTDGGCSGGIWSMTCHSLSPYWPFPQRIGCGTPERIPA